MAIATIFVSSVQKELADERRAVKDFVESDPLLRRFFKIFLFEELPAADRRADSVYLEEVDRSALYVGLFGDAYGFEDAGGVSPTEREFDRATARGKPRLIFVKGSDDGARHAKMAALVRKAGDQLIRRRFGSTPDLTASLYASLVDHLERIGALRTRPFDASAATDANLGDVAEEKLRRFLARARDERRFAVAGDATALDALQHLNLLDHGRPSNAAILLFGRAPQRFLPSSEVKCMHFHGTKVQKPIPSYQIYKGTLFELVDQAVDFALSKLARRVGTRDQATQAPVEYEIPREAVAEAIVNAVAHRDYASAASVQVMLFADRLEVWNPGELPRPLTPALLRGPHPSIPRSPLLAEALFLARYIEKAGTGTLDMIARLKSRGLPEPEFVQEGGMFVQRLHRPRPAQRKKPAAPPRARSESRSESRPESRPESKGRWWRHVPAWKAEWQPGSVHDRIMVAIERHPKSRRGLARALGHQAISGALRRALDDLMTLKLVTYTMPEKPGSRFQRYRARPRPGRA